LIRAAFVVTRIRDARERVVQIRKKAWHRLHTSLYRSTSEPSHFTQRAVDRPHATPHAFPPSRTWPNPPKPPGICSSTCKRTRIYNPRAEIRKMDQVRLFRNSLRAASAIDCTLDTKKLNDAQTVFYDWIGRRHWVPCLFCAWTKSPQGLDFNFENTFI